MSTCKDCLHYEVCECEDCLIRVPEWVNKVEDFCGCFDEMHSNEDYQAKVWNKAVENEKERR